MSAPPVWDVQPGDFIKRKALHDRFGGRRQGGIGPSTASPNVLIFTDPLEGKRHGYIDGWGADGCFHYTGEGQQGDQRLNQGNSAILHHVAQGRALRVFHGGSGVVRYVGAFRLAAEWPYYWTDAPETGGGPVRRVVVFRLQPFEPLTARLYCPDTVDFIPPELEAPHRAPVQALPLEEALVESSFVAPSTAGHAVVQRERHLVRAYGAFLEEQGHVVERHLIRPPGEAKPLFTDLYDATTHTRVAAKANATREAVRMAIGQLLDYRRFLEHPDLAMLLPSEPRPDLHALAGDLDITLVWPEGQSFVQV